MRPGMVSARRVHHTLQHAIEFLTRIRFATSVESLHLCLARMGTRRWFWVPPESFARIHLPASLGSTPVTALPSYYEGSDFLHSSPFGVQDLPDSPARASDRSASKHQMIFRRRFLTLAQRDGLPLGPFPVCVHRVWASPLGRRLARSSGRIEFLSCGPVVRLPLLSTPPYGDAVTVGYGQ